MLYTRVIVSALFVSLAASKKHAGTKLILSNDDGWAVNMVRAFDDALNHAGYNVVLSAPADNKSGTGSTTATPTNRTAPCEFDTCEPGSAIGYNTTNPRLNWVNAYPADASRYGIQTLAPKFFHGPPDLVVAGPNVGWNTGTVVNISGTVGAAVEAARDGFPAIAFSASGNSTDQVSYTTLYTAPDSALSLAARLYATLSVKLVSALLAHGAGSGAANARAAVPEGTIVNVNLGTTNATARTCARASDFRFVFTRVLPPNGTTDVRACGSMHLPDEDTVVSAPGCFVSVSVVNATDKADVGAETQRVVYERVKHILSCFP